MSTTVAERVYYNPVEHLAMGTYWLQVSDGNHRKVKKLIIQ